MKRENRQPNSPPVGGGLLMWLLMPVVQGLSEKVDFHDEDVIPLSMCKHENVEARFSNGRWIQAESAFQAFWMNTVLSKYSTISLPLKDYGTPSLSGSSCGCREAL